LRDAFSEACPIRRFGFCRASGFLPPPPRIGFALHAPAAGAVRVDRFSFWLGRDAPTDGGRPSRSPGDAHGVACPIRRFGFCRASGFLPPLLRIGFAFMRQRLGSYVLDRFSFRLGRKASSA
jgi:hypothetical protein